MVSIMENQLSMENHELVNRVYDLVQKALKKLNEQRLLAEPGGTAQSAGLKPLILTAEHGTKCHPAYERFDGICALLRGYDVDPGSACCVVMYDLTLDSMFKLAVGCADNAYVKLAAEALLKGIPVYAVREGIELLKYGNGGLDGQVGHGGQGGQVGGAYYKELYAHLLKLQACGVTVVPEAELDGVLGACCGAKSAGGECSTYALNECSTYASNECKSMAIGKKAITEADIKHARANGIRELLIEPKAIITSLAAEYAVKSGIAITRRT